MYHLYQQTDRGNVSIIATRSNRHTLRDVMLTKIKHPWPRTPSSHYFIRKCPDKAACSLCAIEIAAALMRHAPIATAPPRRFQVKDHGKRCHAWSTMRARGASWKKIAAIYGMTPGSIQAIYSRHRKNFLAPDPMHSSSG